MVFWQIESQKGARAKRARPLLGGGRRPPPLFAKKCQKSVWKMSGGHFFDIFWTFFQRQPQHQDTFQTLFGHFSGRLPGSPKMHFGTFFFDIFRQFLILTAFSRLRILQLYVSTSRNCLQWKTEHLAASLNGILIGPMVPFACTGKPS